MASAFFCLFPLLLQAGAPLRRPFPVLEFLFQADAFLGGALFLLTGALFLFAGALSLELRGALLFFAGALLQGARKFLLGRALLLHGALALRQAFLPGGAPSFPSGSALPLLPSAFLGGALAFQPCRSLPFFVGPLLLSSAFLFLSRSLRCGTRLFCAGALLLQALPF